jgi:chromosome segregation ATPase
MAQAVLDEAIAERDRQSQRSEGDTNRNTTESRGAVQDAAAAATSNKRPRTESDHNDKNVMEQLKKLWEDSEHWKKGEANDALDATATLVYSQIESLVRSGMEAYHGWESTRRDLSHVEEECEAKERELGRLRASEEQSRATITVRKVAFVQNYSMPGPFCCLVLCMRMCTYLQSFFHLVHRIS